MRGIHSRQKLYFIFFIRENITCIISLSCTCTLVLVWRLVKITIIIFMWFKINLFGNLMNFNWMLLQWIFIKLHLLYLFHINWSLKDHNHINLTKDFKRIKLISKSNLDWRYLEIAWTPLLFCIHISCKKFVVLHIVSMLKKLMHTSPKITNNRIFPTSMTMYVTCMFQLGSWFSQRIILSQVSCWHNWFSFAI